MVNAKLNLELLKTWVSEAEKKISCERRRMRCMQQNTSFIKERERRVGEMRSLHLMLEELSKTELTKQRLRK